MPDVFSVSQLNAYLGCPRKYRFRYLDRREPESKSAAMAFGSAMHGAIEWYWRERIQGRVPSLADAQRMFRVEWTAQKAGGDLAFDEKNPDDMQATGEQLIALFIERFGADVPSDVEVKFEVALHDPRSGVVHPMPLIGYMDFVSPGVVGELKTASKRTDPSAWSLQLSAYSFAMREQTGRGHKLKVIELITTKTPKLEVHEVEKTEAEEAWFLEVAVEALDGIERGAFHPIPGWMCPRCEFRRACRGT